MIPPWLDQPPYRAVTAPLSNGTTDRSADNLERVDAQFVPEAPRYAQSPGITRCNLRVCDFTSAMGCPLPRIWLFGDVWTELNANALNAWLHHTGPVHGWEQVLDRHTAQRAADEGQVVVASWYNPHVDEETKKPKSGHVSNLRPSRGRAGVWGSQAGARNFIDELLEHGFGPIEPDFFFHP